MVLKTRRPKIIGVTGSIAKTSTKEAVYTVLKIKWKNKIAKSEGNLNNEIGLPLAVLLYKKTPHFWQWFWLLPFLFLKSIYLSLPFVFYPDILVLEMAADKPGDIKYLTSFAPPFIGVITAIGPSHLRAFGSVNKVAEEKSEIIKDLPKDGFAVLNKKDPWTKKILKKTKAKVKFFAPTDFDIAKQVAIVVGGIFDIKRAFILKALKSIKPLWGRMNILPGINKSTILNDCYNSNPLSASYALEFLKKYNGERKIAVLGDMLELGDYSKKGHEEIGNKAGKCADMVLTYGDEARVIAERAGGKHFQSKAELVKYLKKELKPKDIVLVKASRGMKFEEIVRAICK